MTKAKTAARKAPNHAGPIKRDAERSQAKILQAATDEFSAHGYDGARVERIAGRCGVNKNLLYHYFDSKEGLYLAVMERLYEGMRASQHDLSLQGLDPVEGMRQLIRHTFQHFIDEPAVISLMNTENLLRAKHIKRSQKIRRLYNPLIDTIAELVRRGRAEGVFQRDVDPVDLYISISALGYFYLANRHTLGFIFGVDLASPERLIKRHEHIADIVLGYLRTP